MKAKIEIEFDTEEPFDLERIRRHVLCDDVVSLLYFLAGMDGSNLPPANISKYVRKQLELNGINFESIWT